jgi:hypothetical protein
MKNNIKITLVDFIFSDNGSFLDDIIFIKSCLSNQNYVSYKVFKSTDSIIKKITNILILYKNSDDLIIVLSAKLWMLYLLAPLCLWKKIAFVYHFIPNKRQEFHRVSVKMLKHLYILIVYSKALKDLLHTKWSINAVYLPSRCIDKERAADLLNDKLKNGSNQLLVPGIRFGVRNIRNIKSILGQIEKNSKLDIRSIVIQTDDPNLSCITKLEKKFVAKLSAENYKELFEKSVCVYIDFDEIYELRASGVLLDAIAAGCIIFSSYHPITEQYGYPNSLLTDLETFEDLTYPLNVNQMLELTGVMDFNTSKLEWTRFINGKTSI